MTDSNNGSAKSACSRCGQPTEGMVALNYLVLPTQETGKICARCAAEDQAASIKSMEETDNMIDETKDLIARLEKLISKNPIMPTVPNGLEGAITPLSIFRFMQLHLAELNSRKMEMLAESDSKSRTDYEIKKAVEAEDYELALELKRRHEKQVTDDARKSE